MADPISVIGSAIVEGIFGSELLAGIAGFGILIALGLALHFTLDCWTVIMTPLIFLLASEVLPFWLWPLYVIGVGILLGWGIIKLVRKT